MGYPLLGYPPARSDGGVPKVGYHPLLLQYPLARSDVGRVPPLGYPPLRAPPIRVPPPLDLARVPLPPAVNRLKTLPSLVVRTRSVNMHHSRQRSSPIYLRKGTQIYTHGCESGCHFDSTKNHGEFILTDSDSYSYIPVGLIGMCMQK